MRRYTIRQRHHDTRQRVCAALVVRGLGRTTAWAWVLRTPYGLLQLIDLQFSLPKDVDTVTAPGVVSTPSSPPPLT